jgi:tRNA pseudouridine55 synthase
MFAEAKIEDSTSCQLTQTPFATLNLYKPKGPTSHDMVAQMRKVFGTKKIGHLGTLDPMAEGVLPICIGNATRLIEYFPDTKTYVASMRLGKETTTLDLEGDVWKERPVPTGITPELLERVFEGFTGHIEQRVPRYSAVHYKGKKLYHYARAGVRIPFEELPVKPVEISHLELIKAHLNQAEPELKIRVSCSSGTYIRSLVRDIAYSLGTVGMMTALVRTRHGRFYAETSHRLEAVKQAENPWALTINPLQCLSLPFLQLDSQESYERLLHGAVLTAQQFTPNLLKNETLALAIHQQKLAGVTQWDNQRLRPRKILDVHFDVDIQHLNEVPIQ